MTAIGCLGCSRRVEFSAPDSIRHYRPVDTAKALEPFSVLFRPQERKAAPGAYRSVIVAGVLGYLVSAVTARTDQMYMAFLLRSFHAHLSHAHLSRGIRTAIKALGD